MPYLEPNFGQQWQQHIARARMSGPRQIVAFGLGVASVLFLAGSLQRSAPTDIGPPIRVYPAALEPAPSRPALSEVRAHVLAVEGLLRRTESVSREIERELDAARADGAADAPESAPTAAGSAPPAMMTPKK